MVRMCGRLGEKKKALFMVVNVEEIAYRFQLGRLAISDY
jgi:hypothetical protein